MLRVCSNAVHMAASGLHRARCVDLNKEAYKDAWERNLNVRIDHVSWWDRELPSQEEMNRGLRELERHRNRVDYIVSHCAPQDVLSAAGFFDSNPLTLYFNTIARNTEFKKWFFGHYHDNRQLLTKWIMLYEQIVRIW